MSVSLAISIILFMASLLYVELDCSMYKVME